MRGISIQFTKLVFFDKTGTPIATQNAQYYIKGSQDGKVQEGKTTCQINYDQTVTCINYTEKDQKMIPKSETIYQVQADGKIIEIGMIELKKSDNQLVGNQE
jgi:hypothetical protein